MTALTLLSCNQSESNTSSTTEKASEVKEANDQSNPVWVVNQIFYDLELPRLFLEIFFLDFWSLLNVKKLLPELVDLEVGFGEVLIQGLLQKVTENTVFELIENSDQLKCLQEADDLGLV